MKAYRVERKIAANGVLQLHALPFREGELVEVIILPHEEKTYGSATQSLRGKVIGYTDPTEPVAQDDWEMLR